MIYVMATDFRDEILSGRIVPGMTFNQRAWAMTARIPRGTVSTYGHMARQLGCNSARAVGNAMNRNPYAPQVPCHRVVGVDGSLVGYAHGLDRKRALLEMEGVPFIGGRVNLNLSLQTALAEARTALQSTAAD